MFKLFAPPEIHRSVHVGQVFCPVRAQDLDVERCVGCSFLAASTAREDGSLGEIVCAPSMHALMQQVEV